MRVTSDFISTPELDREGVTIAVGKDATYDLYLNRALRSAKIVRTPRPPKTQPVLWRECHDGEGVGQALDAFAHRRRALRVFPQPHHGDRSGDRGSQPKTARRPRAQMFLDQQVKSRAMKRLQNASR